MDFELPMMFDRGRHHKWRHFTGFRSDDCSSMILVDSKADKNDALAFLFNLYVAFHCTCYFLSVNEGERLGMSQPNPDVTLISPSRL
jgi:hypothetical protein